MPVCGSLVVYPVAELPALPQLIINLEPTPYDHRAAVVIRAKCGKALTDIVEQLETV